jgi:hypothetical protein
VRERMEVFEGQVPVVSDTLQRLQDRRPVGRPVEERPERLERFVLTWTLSNGLSITAWTTRLVEAVLAGLDDAPKKALMVTDDGLFGLPASINLILHTDNADVDARESLEEGQIMVFPPVLDSKLVMASFDMDSGIGQCLARLKQDPVLGMHGTASKGVRGHEARNPSTQS